MVRQLLIVILSVFIIYGLIEAFPLIAGPALRIDSPSDFAEIPGGIVEIVGRAPRATALTLNGAPLLRDKDGRFATTMTYPLGGAILTFVASDRFGRTTSATRTIFISNP